MVPRSVCPSSPVSCGGAASALGRGRTGSYLRHFVACLSSGCLTAAWKVRHGSPLAPGRCEMWRLHTLPLPHGLHPAAPSPPCLPPPSALNSSPWQGGRGPSDLPSLSISPASLRGRVFTNGEGPHHRSDGPPRVPGFSLQLGSRSRFFPSFLRRNCSRISM